MLGHEYFRLDLSIIETAENLDLQGVRPVIERLLSDRESAEPVAGVA